MDKQVFSTLELEEHKANNGFFPEFTDDAIKLAYVMKDGQFLCADCANGKNNSIAKMSKITEPIS